jgi:CheY-like chemotaxis protein
VWIDADPTRVAQVAGNLLSNAVKFTPAGGTVTVSLTSKEDHAELCVRDTGVGMEPGSVERMFEPFAQAEQSLARTQGGLGLGLALVKGLVELHGGSIQARSEGLGRGAEFLVRLPLADVALDVGSARSVGPRTTSRVVLVIEDNLDTAESLADVIALQGHRVRVAHDGRTGIELARELRPEVILCDIGLPGMNGYEVARALRSDKDLGGTRLIALTGYAQPEDRQRSRGAGFDAHIAKPANMDELLAAVANDDKRCG